jgi:hypothetical protein
MSVPDFAEVVNVMRQHDAPLKQRQFEALLSY